MARSNKLNPLMSDLASQASQMPSGSTLAGLNPASPDASSQPPTNPLDPELKAVEDAVTAIASNPDPTSLDSAMSALDAAVAALKQKVQSSKSGASPAPNTGTPTITSSGAAAPTSTGGY